ncbi:MAG: acetyltransferase [Burkholderiales bacterium]|nr:acetyltransferase [Burkholderiales bacterium]
MKPLVLFGAGKIAEVLLYFFTHHSDRKIVAICVDREFMTEPQWQGLPVVPSDELVKHYPPETHEVFVALGYQRLNAARAEKCAQLRALGYALPSYVHPESGLPRDCVIGDNCFIMNQVLIHPRVKIGNNVFVWSGAMIGHHSTVGDNCWLTSCANISGEVIVGENCFFAVNSTIANQVKIGKDCFIGANALVTKCTGDEQVFLAENSKPFRLNTHQFLRMSRFS